MLSRFSRVQLCATPWTVARQAPLSLGFSRQEHWSGLPCPPPGHLPDPGIEPGSPALQVDSLLLSHQEGPEGGHAPPRLLAADEGRGRDAQEDGVAGVADSPSWLRGGIIGLLLATPQPPDGVSKGEEDSARF